MHSKIVKQDDLLTLTVEEWVNTAKIFDNIFVTGKLKQQNPFTEEFLFMDVAGAGYWVPERSNYDGWPNDGTVIIRPDGDGIVFIQFADVNNIELNEIALAVEGKVIAHAIGKAIAKDNLLTPHTVIKPIRPDDVEMSEETMETLAKIRGLCLRSISDGEYTYEHDDELRDLCEILSKDPNYGIWAPSLYKLIEEFDADVDLTLGSPGPLVHLLEMKFADDVKQFREFLLASLARKPTGLVTSMGTMYAVSSDEDRDVWVQIFKDVLNHPKATVGAKEIAKDTLDNNWHGR